MSEAEVIDSPLITKINNDLMSHRFTKKSDESRYNGQDPRARNKQEMKAFTLKRCHILQHVNIRCLNRSVSLSSLLARTHKHGMDSKVYCIYVNRRTVGS